MAGDTSDTRDANSEFGFEAPVHHRDVWKLYQVLDPALNFGILCKRCGRDGAASLQLPGASPTVKYDVFWWCEELEIEGVCKACAFVISNEKLPPEKSAKKS